jgi:hypothetical protein
MAMAGALSLASRSQASLTRASSSELAPAAVSPSIARPLALEESRTFEPRFDLFAGDELTRAATEPGSVETFHPLAAVSLLPEDARLDLAPEPDARYPKTRVWAIDVLGSTLVSRSSGLSLESDWACVDFSCGLVSGGRKDPLGLVTFIRAESGGPADVLGSVNVESGVTALDYTLFAGLNTAANFVNRFVNAGANALYFMGEGQGALEDALKKYTGASDADIEFLKIYAVTNPAEVAAAINSLRSGASQATTQLDALLQRIRQTRNIQSTPALRSVGAAANQDVQAAKAAPALRNAVLSSNAKGNLGQAWSRAAAEARGEEILGEEVDLIFTINGKKVGVRADVLSRPEGSSTYTYIESKWSGAASYTEHQAQVIPELVKAGDAGLWAEVGARSGSLRRGARIKVQFQGDVWSEAPTLLGQ